MDKSSSRILPVVTFLTSHRIVAQRAQSFLTQFFQMKSLPSPAVEDAFPSSSSSLLDKSSYAVQCPVSDCILQFIPIHERFSGYNNNRNHNTSSSSALTFFSIHALHVSNDNNNTDRQISISSARKGIEDHILIRSDHSWLSSIKLRTMSLFDFSHMQKVVSEVLLPGVSLPLVDLNHMEAFNYTSNNDVVGPSSSVSLRLKEVCIPYFPTHNHDDDGDLYHTLCNSSIRKPMVGLFQWPSMTDNNGIILRPVPAASEDRTLPSPSLIFHCEKNDEGIRNISQKVQNSGGAVSKVGFNGGLRRKGQVCIKHDDLPGIDVRLCPQQDLSSSFSELQESLFAGSLTELQSSRVLSKGGSGKESGAILIDERTNAADCWIELRASLKNPSGFFRKKAKLVTDRKDDSNILTRYLKDEPSNKRRIAKAPDIPYE